MKFPELDLANPLAPDKIKNRNRIAPFFLLRVSINAVVGDVSQPPVRRQGHFMRLDAYLHLGEPLAGIRVIKADRVIPLVHDDSDLLSVGGGREQRQPDKSSEHGHSTLSFSPNRVYRRFVFN